MISAPNQFCGWISKSQNSHQRISVLRILLPHWLDDDWIRCQTLIIQHEQQMATTSCHYDN